MARKRGRGQLRQTARGAGQVKEVDFGQEYYYVLSDLKRFGLLALAMFALLIVLALALPAF